MQGMKMNEPKMPECQWGQFVKAAANLYNDGTVPDALPDALLIPSDTPGEIVNVGVVEASGEPLYLVEFTGGHVIGVFENEIVRA